MFKCFDALEEAYLFLRKLEEETVTQYVVIKAEKDIGKHIKRRDSKKFLTMIQS